MTDLEMTKLCAEAMGLTVSGYHGDAAMVWKKPDARGYVYDPLHNDAQAMALVKKFDLSIINQSGVWIAGPRDGVNNAMAGANLNRVIVGTVAQIQVHSTEAVSSAGLSEAECASLAAQLRSTERGGGQDAV